MITELIQVIDFTRIIFVLFFHIDYSNDSSSNLINKKIKYHKTIDLNDLIRSMLLAEVV
jgi:hypothetical protein